MSDYPQTATYPRIANETKLTAPVASGFEQMIRAEKITENIHMMLNQLEVKLEPVTARREMNVPGADSQSISRFEDNNERMEAVLVRINRLVNQIVL